MALNHLRLEDPLCPCKQINIQQDGFCQAEYCPQASQNRLDRLSSCPFAPYIAAQARGMQSPHRRPDTSERLMSSTVVRTRKKALVEKYSGIVVIILTRELARFWPDMPPEEIQEHAHAVMSLILTKISVVTPEGKPWRSEQHASQVQEILDTYINNLKNKEF